MEVIRQKSLLCAANNFKDACKLRCSYISCVWTGTLQTHTSTHLNLETVNRFVLFWQSIMRLCVFRFTERICCFRFTGVFFPPLFATREDIWIQNDCIFVQVCHNLWSFWLNSFSACAHFLNTISVEVLQSMWNVHVRRFEIKQFQYNLLLLPKRHNRCRVQEAEQEKAPDDDSAFPFGKI